jgi:energy-coupling factor transporter ATP-binding protein EcfA2
MVAKRGAAITGPAGVGKTTLVVTCLQLAQAEGMSLVRTTGTRASRGLPFGAFASILPPDPGGDGLVREDHPELLRRYGRAVPGGTSSAACWPRGSSR